MNLDGTIDGSIVSIEKSTNQTAKMCRLFQLATLFNSKKCHQVHNYNLLGVHQS